MTTTLPERTELARADEAHAPSVAAGRGPSLPPSPARRGGSWLTRKTLIGGLIFGGVILLVIVVWKLSSGLGASDSNLVFYTVKRGDLPIEVTEGGSLQSQKTTELRCEVENVGYEREGTQILSIVDNGVDVKEGDLLVELDAALIQDRLDDQELATERARSQQIQATAKFENQKTQNETTLAEAKLQVDLAELAVLQYEDEDGGTFLLDLQGIDLQIQTAEAKRLIASTDLRGIEMLKKLGYRSRGDLEQARLSALSADRELATAVSSRKELVDYTYRKTKMQLEGAVASAKRALIQVERDNEALLLQAEAAKNEADRALAKEEEKLAKYRLQLENCKIYAPHDGMATYATEGDGRSHVREGSTVRERQRIITLPNLSMMEVKTGVHESVLDWIQEGMSATITVDAFSDRKYKGTVKSVAVLADRGEWHSSDVKVYTTVVTIDQKVERLRPGMSAVVNIHVDRLQNVLSVPVQAVVQISKQSWCYVEAGRSVELRQVTLGKTNDKFVEIREGLNEGDRVVLNPMALVEQQKNAADISPDADLDQDETPEAQANDSPSDQASDDQTPAA